MRGTLPDTTDLHARIADGDRDAVVEWLVQVPAAQRLRLRPTVRRHHDVLMAEPAGARSPDGHWRGGLRSAHWSAAQAALLGCSTLRQAVTYAPLDQPDARDLPRLLFPGELEAFVEEWSARFLRNPRAWDRIRGLDAMFDWAQAGLVAPPLHDGAVLYLATAVPGATSLLRYLERHPVLITSTLPRIFDVDGIKGASPAQADEHHHAPGRGLHDHVIPTLVRRGLWRAEDVVAGIDRALGRDLGGYQHRWFHRLRERVEPLLAHPSR